MKTVLPAQGRCLCGEVTYTCTAKPLWAAYCHCQSCRLNTASPVTAYFGIADNQWTWTGKTPKIFEGNAGVRRYFCDSCGTPIAYQADKYPGETHFYTAALENTSGFEPTGHVNFGEHLSWFDTRDTFNRYNKTAGGE